MFADLETPLAEAPLFFIEPKDSNPASEADRQAELVATIKRTFPQARPVAILNGEKRGQWALNLARRLGAWWGFPDLLVLAPRKIAMIEMKNGKDMPKQHQVDVLNWLHRSGFAVGVFRTSDSAIAFLRKQGFGG